MRRGHPVPRVFNPEELNMKKKDDKKIILTQGISDLEVVDKINDIRQSFESGQLSRRSFMMGALAMGVSLTAASALLNKVEAATPKMGGRLRVGLTGGATTDTLDPGQILDLYMILYLIFIHW